jgi:CxxC motif-containing protein
MSEPRFKEITCIICPNGCHIMVTETEDGELDIQDATCKRGIEYSGQEFREPKRMLLTTVRIENGILPVLPVRSNVPIPKEKIFEAVQFVSGVATQAPVKMGDVIVADLFGLGVDVIASRDMEAKSE